MITEEKLRTSDRSLTLADKAIQLDLLRKIEKACADYDFDTVAAVSACMLVSACLQIARNKTQALSHLDKTYLRMADIIESNFASIKKDAANGLPA